MRSRVWRALVLLMAAVGALAIVFVVIGALLWFSDEGCWRTSESAVGRTAQDFERRAAAREWARACALLTDAARRSYGTLAAGDNRSCTAGIRRAAAGRRVRRGPVSRVLVDPTTTEAHVHTDTQHYTLTKDEWDGCGAWRIDSALTWER